MRPADLLLLQLIETLALRLAPVFPVSPPQAAADAPAAWGKEEAASENRPASSAGTAVRVAMVLLGVAMVLLR